MWNIEALYRRSFATLEYALHSSRLFESNSPRRGMVLNVLDEIRMLAVARNLSLDWLHEKPPITQHKDLCYSSIQRQLHFVSDSVRNGFGTCGTVRLFCSHLAMISSSHARSESHNRFSDEFQD
jgi:hypothetical protein